VVTAIPEGDEQAGVNYRSGNHAIDIEEFSDGNDTEPEIAVRLQPSTLALEKSKPKIPIAPINWTKG